jgi:hypothetical protein
MGDRNLNLRSASAKKVSLAARSFDRGSLPQLIREVPKRNENGQSAYSLTDHR